MGWPVKVIIDTDLGVDDAIAILMALAWPELELVGVTTVGGNLPWRGARATPWHYWSTLAVGTCRWRGGRPVLAGAVSIIPKASMARLRTRTRRRFTGSAARRKPSSV